MPSRPKRKEPAESELAARGHRRRHGHVGLGAIDGDRCVLGRSPRFAPTMWSCLAGFVEPGETLEEAVAREIEEEVGVRVGDVRYFGSQAWPFPHSLMIGFKARYLAGEIRLAEPEIEAAGWFRVDTLPPLPSSISIARTLIEDFIARKT